MKRATDIALFLTFAVGGLWLAHRIGIAVPFVLLIALLLSVHYWKTQRRVLASLCGVLAVPLLVMPIAIGGLFLAAQQWDDIRQHHAKTRREVEAHVFLARTVQPTAFTGLYMSSFFQWNTDDRSWHDLNGRVYTPAEGDRYYAYKVIGFLPIDVIYDRNDDVKMAFNSFDF